MRAQKARASIILNTGSSNFFFRSYSLDRRILPYVTAIFAVVMLANLPLAMAKNENWKETIWLDTYADFDKNETPLLESPYSVSQMVLENGKRYMIMLSGTFSVWTPGTWTSAPIAGMPEPAPMYESPSTSNGYVGWDPEYFFAWPAGAGSAPGPLPGHQSAIQMSLDGVTWSHIEPVSKNYKDSHSYNYLVTGQGHPLKIFLDDGNFRDNYGILQCKIHQLGR